MRHLKILFAAIAVLSLGTAALAGSSSGGTYSQVHVNKGLLDVYKKVQVGRTVGVVLGRTFTVSITTGDELVSSGDTGSPGFYLERVATDADPMHDSASIGAVSGSGIALLSADYGDQPALVLCPGAGECDSATMTRLWAEDDTGKKGGLMTGVGRFRQTVYTNYDSATNKGDSLVKATAAIENGSGTYVASAGVTLNWCFAQRRTAGAAPSGTVTGRTFTIATGDVDDDSLTFDVLCSENATAVGG